MQYFTPAVTDCVKGEPHCKSHDPSGYWNSVPVHAFEIEGSIRRMMLRNRKGVKGENDDDDRSMFSFLKDLSVKSLICK